MTPLRFRAWHNELQKMIEFHNPKINDEYSYLAFEAVDEEYQGICALPDGFDHGEIVVMQSTGLKDKNGVEIWEFDIIRYIGVDGKEYVQECPSLTSWHFWQETEDNDTVEMIGNKFENPHLLPS